MNRTSWIPLAILILGFPLALLYLANISTTGLPSFGVGPIVSALLVHVTAIALLILIWQGVLKQGAQIRIEVLEGLAHISQTLMGKYLPGKVWGFLSRGVMLNRKFSGVDDNVAVVVVEQLMIMHAAAICCGVLGAVYYALQSGTWWVIPLAGMVAAISVIGMALGLNQAKRLSAGVLRLFRAAAMKPSAVWDNLAGLVYVRNVLLFCLYWLLLAAIVVVLFWDWFFAGVFDAAFYSRLVIVFGAVPAGVVAGFLVLWVPSGIGVREGVIAAILGLQFPLEQAVMMSVVYRIWCVLADFVIGFWGVFLARRYS